MSLLDIKHNAFPYALARLLALDNVDQRMQR